MNNIAVMTESEYEQIIKLQQVMYVFSKMETEAKIDVLFKIDGLNNANDFIDFYFDDLCYEFDLEDYDYNGGYQCSFKDVKNEWNSLLEDMQLDLVIKYICNDDLDEFIEEYLEQFYKHFEPEINKIHWIELMACNILPREDVIGNIKEMLATEGREYLIKKYKIDKNIDLNSLTDSELKELHYQLEGVMY